MPCERNQLGNLLTKFLNFRPATALRWVTERTIGSWYQAQDNTCSDLSENPRDTVWNDVLRRNHLPHSLEHETMSTNENTEQKNENVELTEEQTEQISGGRTKWDGPGGSKQCPCDE